MGNEAARCVRYGVRYGVRYNWIHFWASFLPSEKEAPAVSFAGSNLHVLYWSNLPKGSHFINHNIRDKVPEDESLD